MQFKELKVIPEILKALEEENYSQATPIQEEAIPIILDGKDLLGCAQTGTGKTAAFAIPTLQLLSKEQEGRSQTRDIVALILTPTRELAIQIYESTGTDIDRIMPPVSRFASNSRTIKKQTIIDKLLAFFEKYFGLV